MQRIKIDFDNPGLPQRLDVVENDAQSRFFKAVLYKDGKSYTAPSGATYSIMYRGFGPQNEGWYDTINDGAGKRAACSVSGNVVICEIARQALRVPGHVSVMLCVTRSNGYMLHGWPIDCNCRNESYTDGTSVESFFYITQVTNAEWTSAIKTWEELKNMIDPTLSLSGKAADAAKVGEAVGQIKEDLEVLNQGGLNLKDEVIGKNVTDWLDKHPEATTTVQNGSLTEAKISPTFLLYIKKDYVTPEMFGAVGDGVTDDYNALQSWINSYRYKLLPSKTYCTSKMLTVNNSQKIEGAYRDFSIIKMIGNENYILNIKSINTVVDNITFDCNNLCGGIAIKDFETDDTRITGSKIRNCAVRNIGANSIGMLLDCANGYNYFDNNSFRCSKNGCDTFLKIGDTYGGTYQGIKLSINYVYVTRCVFNWNANENDGTGIKMKNASYIWVDGCDISNNANIKKYAVDIEDSKNIQITRTTLFNCANGLKMDRTSSSKYGSGLIIDRCEIKQHDTVEGMICDINPSNIASMFDISFKNNIIDFKHSNRSLKFSNINSGFIFKDNHFGNNIVNVYKHTTLINATPKNSILVFPSCRFTVIYDGTENTYTVSNNSRPNYYKTSISGKVLTIVYTNFNELTHLTYRNVFISRFNNTDNVYIQSVGNNNDDGTITIKIVLGSKSDTIFAVGIQ